jgi:uncharacterized spore protein YtfJ
MDPREIAKAGREVVAAARDAVGARKVFGEAVERDGVTVLPAATVIGGGGGGGGTSEVEGAGDDEAPRLAGGLGYGLVGWPSGAFEIREGRVQWHPAFDVNRLLVFAMLFALLLVRALRS